MEIKKYVDRLPIPKVLSPKFRIKGASYYTVEMRQVKQKLHRDIPETTVWGYEGTYPGPTIEVEKHELVLVTWLNNLPVDKHLLPVDITVHGAGPPNPIVRTVVHLHGGHVPPESDGYPEAWFTNGFAQTGDFFKTKTYVYPNRQNATTLWYHDHALGITRLNVYSGLAGFYLIRDSFERSLNLPRGDYEIPLVIQDRSFTKRADGTFDGSLFYPRGPEPLPENYPDPSIVPEFFGDTILVNGKAWPFLNVEPRKYRFRILNGSNSRFYKLKLSTGQSFYQIGTDGGLLRAPVKTNYIIIAPGERADVILDFSKAKLGDEIVMTNDAPTPFPNGPDLPDPDTTGQIMKFKVTIPLRCKDTSKIPYKLRPVPKIREDCVKKTRDLLLVERTDIDEFGRLMLLLDNKTWDDPVSEDPKLGTTEIWRLINTTPDTHPIHLHLVQFQILDRQRFHIEGNKVILDGGKILPDLNERGWKDTIRANPGEVTRIIARFGDFTGRYVWHCHILEHEDFEMMRPYIVRR